MGKLLLFDIDNTLLFTGGAGSRAFNQTFEALYGIEQAFAGIPFGGRTDQAILRDALLKHGLIADGAQEFRAAVDLFQEHYLERLPVTLQTLQGGAVLPGVVDLLEALAPRPDVYLGLATGNFRSSAMMKLDHYGLRRYFLDGGFADDAEDRGELVAAAARRMLGHEAVPPGEHEVVVFGDTPHDVSAATVNGYRAVGVATGGSSAQDLEESGAHHVFEDLTDTKAVLSTLGIPGSHSDKRADPDRVDRHVKPTPRRLKTKD